MAPRDSDDRSPAASKGPPDSPEVTARVRDALELVPVMALKIRASLHVTTPAEELVSFGNEGLLRAARTFDESRGVPFRCWATLRIRGAILDGVRSSGTLPRRVYRRMKEIEAADAIQETLVEEDAARPPVVEPGEADARLSRYMATMATAMALASRDSSTRDIDNVVDTTPSPEQQVARAELETALLTALHQIPEQEQHVVRRYYFDEASLDDIGKVAQGPSRGRAASTRARSRRSRASSRGSAPSHERRGGSSAPPPTADAVRSDDDRDRLRARRAASPSRRRLVAGSLPAPAMMLGAWCVIGGALTACRRPAPSESSAR